MLRGRYIALNVYIRKEERSQSNYLNFHLKKLEKKRKLIPMQIEGSK